MDTRSARKREAIMGAARTVFLRGGYSGASMDEVAALAVVSKQTVYKHFADKETLFTAIITADVAEATARSEDVVEALPDTDDVAELLGELARRMATVLTQPQLLRMRRILIGEADRFPELARIWFESGPGRSYTRLATIFSGLTDRGLLATPDPLLAAQQFTWLVLGIPLNRAMFILEPEDEVERYAAEGVRVFLSAYGA